MCKNIFSSCRGFTLIEVLVTIVILGILAAIATPSMDEMFERRRLTGAAEAIYDQLIMARSEAIKQSRDTYVRFQPGTAWCFGVNDLPNPTATRCDCNQTNSAEANACTLLLHGAQNRVLQVLSSNDFRNVSITSPTALTDIRFDFVRGTAIGSNNTFTLTTAPRGYELRVRVSNVGRVIVCRQSTATPIGGYPVCPT